jgi:hypothetical protein
VSQRDLDWFQRGMDTAIATKIVESLKKLLLPLPMRPYTSRDLRATWRLRFAADGWALNYPLGSSNLTVPFLKNEVGVCIQLGNVCRVYADLIKLRSLSIEGKISCGVLAVPSFDFSQQLGSNHADYARLERDLDVLYPAIELPLLVIAVDGIRG